MPDDAEARATTRDSLLVAAGTIVARASGVVRVLVIGAVLGPTWIGNAYQVTNSLPNLVYYGLLAGSLVSSLLVPLLVRQVDAARPDRIGAICGGFLGIVLAAGALLLPLVAWAFPHLLAAAAAGAPGATGGQAQLARMLVVMTVPQVFLYAVAGSGAAVLYAHRRFVLAALAPAAENLGVITVLVLVAVVYGAPRGGGSTAPTGELVLLGLGSTLAVGMHAALQWWGAARCGVRLRPRRGWRDPDVREALRRAANSLAQAALLATQTLALLLVASRVAGGAVALQIALNFYFLPIALVATPVGLALLPRLARLADARERGEFSETLLQGLMLALFMAVPAAAGYAAVSRPIARVVAAGQMATPAGEQMIAAALTMLAIGLAGHTVFFIATQAAYARGDTRSPLRSMALQTLVCCSLAGLATASSAGPAVVQRVAAAYAVGSLVGGAHLLLHVVERSPAFLRRLGRSGVRVALGTGLMLAVVLALRAVSESDHAGRSQWAASLGAMALAGVATYAVAQVALRAPEVGWLRHGVASRSGGAR